MSEEEFGFKLTFELTIQDYNKIKDVIVNAKQKWEAFDNYMLREGQYDSIVQFLRNYYHVMNTATYMLVTAEELEDYEFCHVLKEVVDETQSKYDKIDELDLYGLNDKELYIG